MTFESETLDALVKETDGDATVTIREYMMLRDEADRRMDDVTAKFGKHNNLDTFKKSMDVSVQLLQLRVMQAKEAELTQHDEAVVKDAVRAQVEYLRVGCDLALSLL
jgi:hypothetical protein